MEFINKNVQDQPLPTDDLSRKGSASCEPTFSKNPRGSPDPRFRFVPLPKFFDWIVTG